MVVLHEAHLAPDRRVEGALVPALEEEAARVAEDAGLDQQDVGIASAWLSSAP
jgi:hypothetical protein